MPVGCGKTGSTASPSRYWIDADGRLLRFQARLGGEAQWANAELHRTPSAKPLPDPPAQLSGAGSQDR